MVAMTTVTMSSIKVKPAQLCLGGELRIAI
jgi:hypothetical protein